MAPTQRLSLYDRLRPHLDAADIIRRLGLKESRTIGSEAYLAPLCHESDSGESLQVNLHTGRWNCKACQSAGVYGDLFQLVEYALTRGQAPSRGEAQGASLSHCEALEWLCAQYGVPFDDGAGAKRDPALDVVHLFAMAAHEHLLESPEVLEWIQERWGFDRATVEAYGIGYMPAPILPAIANEARRPESRGAFRSSGLGWFRPDGSFSTHFAGRVLFPYLEHGRGEYLIGRATKWTPALEHGGRPPKYHKLSVHSETRPYVSERITNDHLYNEPVMSTAHEIGIVEGVADAVALSALGVPVVSPVTISFNAVDQERFLRKCHENGIRRVWILFDNELSGSGNWAARRVGLKLVEGGLSVRIATLPLGEQEQQARDEVLAALGREVFDELEKAEPHKRKAMIAAAVPDEAKRAWLIQQVAASKIDAAEWVARQGAGAAGRFDAVIRESIEVLALEISDVTIQETDDASTRADAFEELVALAAHVDDRLAREGYAGLIAAAAGKGVTKAEIARRISETRREVVKPKRKEAADERKVDRKEIEAGLVLLPPEQVHTQPVAPTAPASPSRPGAPAAPPPPGQKVESDYDRYASARDSVGKAVEAKLAEETVGRYVAETILRSMGYTAFRTPEELYLVRGSERIPVGLENPTPRFADLLLTASGLTPRKASHRAYIALVTYFLGRAAREVPDVSWSFVDQAGAVFFPTGDALGRLLKIEPGKVTPTKMSAVRVPTVPGEEFQPFEYVEQDGGIERMSDVFRWTSISAPDRLVLVYWLVCLPILRRIGTVPIVRIEGGSSSGKTRTVDAVSFLVNGRRSSSVPTAAALVSRLSSEMLTVDDNRESGDVTPAFLGTLLQATHLGAREKRKAHSDTGTVIERVSGALLMNGIEPIHDGRPELASRMLTLRCQKEHRAKDSPTSDKALTAAILAGRSAFWSEAARRCAAALELDETYGEHVGGMIERVFGVTKIGRLSSFLRLQYLAWVAGIDDPVRASRCLDELAEPWADAFRSIASGSLRSLIGEELAVSVVRYVLAYGQTLAVAAYHGAPKVAFEGKYVEDPDKGDTYLGPIKATTLARLARTAGRELNAPDAITRSLRAGQLEQRILDGLDYLEAAGLKVDIDTTTKGRHRFTFQLPRGSELLERPSALPEPGDTWLGE